MFYDFGTLDVTTERHVEYAIEILKERSLSIQQTLIRTLCKL